MNFEPTERTANEEFLGYKKLIDSLRGEHGINMTAKEICDLCWYLFVDKSKHTDCERILGFHPSQLHETDLLKSKSLIFALIMIGNTGSYTFENWKDDSKLLRAYYQGAQLWMEYLVGIEEHHEVLNRYSNPPDEERIEFFKPCYDSSFESYRKYLQNHLFEYKESEYNAFHGTERIVKYGFYKCHGPTRESAEKLCDDLCFVLKD